MSTRAVRELGGCNPSGGDRDRRRLLNDLERRRLEALTEVLLIEGAQRAQAVGQRRSLRLEDVRLLR